MNFVCMSESKGDTRSENTDLGCPQNKCHFENAIKNKLYVWWTCFYQLSPLLLFCIFSSLMISFAASPCLFSLTSFSFHLFSITLLLFLLFWQVSLYLQGVRVKANSCSFSNQRAWKLIVESLPVKATVQYFLSSFFPSSLLCPLCQSSLSLHLTSLHGFYFGFTKHSYLPLVSLFPFCVWSGGGFSLRLGYMNCDLWHIACQSIIWHRFEFTPCHSLNLLLS